MLTEDRLSALELEVRLMELIKSSHTSAERGALAQLLSELSHVGHTPLIKASQRLLKAKGLVCHTELESALQKVCSPRRPAQSESATSYAYLEEELLLEQMRELMMSLALDRQMKLISPIEWLRESLWSDVVMSWVERLEEAHERGEFKRELGLVIHASDELGQLLEYDPFRFAHEGVDLIAHHLRGLELGGGEVSVLLPAKFDRAGWEALRVSGLLHDLRGVKRLNVDGFGLLRLLKPEVVRGLEHLKELNPIILSDDELAELAQHPLLHVVYAGVKDRPPRAELSEALTSQLKGALKGTLKEVPKELLSVAERCCSRVMSRVTSPAGEAVFYERVIPGGVSCRGERVAPFLMMETAVTQELYAALMGANPSRHRGQHNPVEQVNCADGVQLANALSEALGLTQAYEGAPHEASMVKRATGFKLPFEAEWVWAAQGGEAHRYAGSDKLREVGWSAHNAQGVSRQVAQLKPNRYGLYDMSGGVFEWLSDAHFSPGHYDPKATMRAYRGGSWDSTPALCEIDRKAGNTIDRRAPFVGLRLCRALP